VVVTSEMVEHPKAEGKFKTCSVWVDPEKLKAFKAAVDLAGTVSYGMELNAFFDRRTRELKGLTPNGPNGDSNAAEEREARRQRYEADKKRIFEIDQDIMKLVKFLREQQCWYDFIDIFTKYYIDYNGTFEPPETSHWGTPRQTQDVYDTACIGFIEEASDRESDFKLSVARFHSRNKDLPFVHDRVAFLEKVRDRRKLGRLMLMYQMDQLSPEELELLNKKNEERDNQHREEARLKAEKEEAKKLERQKGFQQVREKRLNVEETVSEDSEEDEFPEDTEEEDDARLSKILEEEKKDKENSEKEETEEGVTPETPEGEPDSEEEPEQDASGTSTFLALSSRREIVPVSSKEQGGGETVDR
jgi:hypothetical protein